MNFYNIIAMIPGRLGSKRIPRKNIRYMEDKPLIQYPIDLAITSNKFESVWVNTEHVQLGKAVEIMGARFHERPVELASDTATNRDFVYEFLKKHICDYVVMINPTSPLLRLTTLLNFLDYVCANNLDTVLSVVSDRAETFFQDRPLNFKFSEKINSQFLEPVEKVVWALTAWKRESFLRLNDEGTNPVFGGNVGKFVIPKDESCDLDTEEDWHIAEGILESRKNENKPRRYMEL
jgi:CMP-N-acetylneuraminic acid synthetase